MKDSNKKDILQEELLKPINPIIAFIRMKLEEADRSRSIKESQWLDNINALRGLDSGRSLRPETELKSIFVRTTSTKTKAAFSQISEALLGNDNFPISVEPTTIPEGIAEFAYIKDPAAASEPHPLDVGFAGDGIDLPAGAKSSDVNRVLGEAFDKRLNPEMFEEGIDITGQGVQLSPAKQAARMMQKRIFDQLEESKAKTSLRKALYEACMLGTGAMKGPFAENVKINKYEGGKLTEETKLAPRLDFVSIWDLYIDPNAFMMEDIAWIIERHRLNRTQVRNLNSMPHFDPDAIEQLVMGTGNYMSRGFETSLRPLSIYESEGDLFEVLEYWGYMDAKVAREQYKLNLPEGVDGSIQVNCWISGDQVLRVVVNPFAPARIPYFLFPYEQDPYSLYGVGVPELMQDLQVLMNGMTRLAVENAMLAGNVLLDVDTSALRAGEDMSVYPGKIFERQAGSQGTAVSSIEIPFVAHQNMQMFSQFRQMADEATGIQSILHGQTGVSGTGRTSSGLALLMDSASMSIKNVIRNIDDHLLKPIGTAYFQWNMQFKAEDFPEIKGDLDIKAMGSHNLISKERKAAKLQTFLQLSTNPAIAPFIRLPTIIKELAIQMEISPEEILNSPEESMAYAQLQAMMNPQPQGGAGQVPMGGGLPPSPEDPGFTGNNEGAGNQAGVQGPPQF
ncbi:portal protein [Pseudoalteromonas phage vB_PtuP_Slicky01]|nr:portal protein [Pseudoalteromonas phage vB_PtuP_Slicky01]